MIILFIIFAIVITILVLYTLYVPLIEPYMNKCNDLNTFIIKKYPRARVYPQDMKVFNRWCRRYKRVRGKYPVKKTAMKAYTRIYSQRHPRF